MDVDDTGDLDDTAEATEASDQMPVSATAEPISDAVSSTAGASNSLDDDLNEEAATPPTEVVASADPDPAVVSDDHPASASAYASSDHTGAIDLTESETVASEPKQSLAQAVAASPSGKRSKSGFLSPVSRSSAFERSDTLPDRASSSSSLDTTDPADAHSLSQQTQKEPQQLPPSVSSKSAPVLASTSAVSRGNLVRLDDHDSCFWFADACLWLLQRHLQLSLSISFGVLAFESGYVGAILYSEQYLLVWLTPTLVTASCCNPSSSANRHRMRWTSVNPTMMLLLRRTKLPAAQNASRSLMLHRAALAVPSWKSWRHRRQTFPIVARAMRTGRSTV